MGKDIGRQLRGATNILRVFKQVFLVFLVGISVSCLMWPAAANAQSYTFSSIQIDGNQRIEDGTILSYAGIALGTPVSNASLNSSYQTILGTGVFESVEYLPDGNRLIIRVKEYPTINRINIEGNDKVNDEAALAAITSQPRRVFNPNQIERDAAALTALYQNQGRLTASVTPKIIKRTDNRVDVVFEVTEGRKVEIERISFVGNNKFSDGRLRRVLESKQAGLLRVVIQSDTFVEDRVQLDKLVLEEFYQLRGYVDFEVLSVASEFSRERNAFFLTFKIREGQSFKFGQIGTSSSLPEVNEADFLEASNVRPGQTFSPLAVDNVIARMERLALQKGLNFIRVEPRITRNNRDLTQDVVFELVRGPRIFIERIDIEGNATTLDRVIRRRFDIVEGDPFNPREVRESALDVQNSGLFADAGVNTSPGSADDQVVVKVLVAEQPTGSLGFGGTYSVSDGVGLTASFRERNFLGRGQTLNFNLSAGLDNFDGGIAFVEPAFLGRDVAFGTILEYRSTSYDYTSYDTEAKVFEISFGFPVSDNGRLKLDYSLQDESIFDVSNNSSQILKDEEALGSVTSSALGYTYSYDTRRTGLDPTSGIVFRFGQQLGGLGGEEKYIKSEILLAGETMVANEEITLRAVLEGGALEMFSGDSRLNERFFLDSSRLRGFRPAGVGPRDLTVPNEDVLGGNYFAVARLETEFPIGLPEEYGVTLGFFADVGSVWGLDNTGGGAVDDDAYLRATAGVSLFWTTAIGPLRFNFSRALRKESYDEEQNFDLTISTEF